MHRPLALAAVVLVALLAIPATAPAKGGSWWTGPGVQHLHFETAPIAVRPGQNSIDNVVVPATAKPKVDGWIVRMRPDLHDLDGTVPPVDVVHLHHGVWLNASGSSPAAPFGTVEPIFFGGEEKTIFRIPRGYGYRYRATDQWVISQMIHNNTAQARRVRLAWDLDFIAATSPTARGIRRVTPLWMDVRRGSGYPVFDVAQGSGGADGAMTWPQESPTDPYAGDTPQNRFTMPFAATIVAAVGHLHPGGLRDDVDVLRPGRPGARRIFRSQAKYYDPAGPVSWDVSLTASRPDWRVRVRRGDTIRINATYDAARSSWYENMGIVLLYAARNDRSGPDPFRRAVDWRGVLTHGHLPETDNHGGGNAVLPDARSAPDGPATTEVDIRGYQFRPGDLSLLLAPGAGVPVVPQGQSLTFRNFDDTKVEWHSITTCASPCNGSTGVSYPLADGGPGAQFDSGQLGFGPAGLSPAANRDTWQTPADLAPGTYTYFCRIHNFMRGAFRVTPAAARSTRGR